MWLSSKFVWALNVWARLSTSIFMYIYIFVQYFFYLAIDMFTYLTKSKTETVTLNFLDCVSTIVVTVYVTILKPQLMPTMPYLGFIVFVSLF